jgi:hypothetical protein
MTIWLRIMERTTVCIDKGVVAQYKISGTVQYDALGKGKFFVIDHQN